MSAHRHRAAENASVVVTEAAPPTTFNIVLGAHHEDPKHVKWAAGTVDNEGMGKRSSKRCCIYHKPREFGESSSESDTSSDSDSDSSTDAERARASKPSGGKRHCACRGHGHGPGDNSSDSDSDSDNEDGRGKGDDHSSHVPDSKDEGHASGDVEGRVSASAATTGPTIDRAHTGTNPSSSSAGAPASASGSDGDGAGPSGAGEGGSGGSGAGGSGAGAGAGGGAGGGAGAGGGSGTGAGEDAGTGDEKDDDTSDDPAVALDAAKAEFRKLCAEKDKLEADIQDAIEALGPMGMDAPLIDPDGFPRADVDHYAIRTLRGSLARMQNDHCAVMNKIQAAIEQVHAAARKLESSGSGPARASGAGVSQAPASAASRASPGASAGATTGPPQPHPDLHLAPLAIVNSVADGSPASTAGLVKDDLVLRFGSASSENASTLSAVADIVHRNVGVALPVIVRRGDSVEALTLTPGSWAGRGLLGVHLLPPPGR